MARHPHEDEEEVTTVLDRRDEDYPGPPGTGEGTVSVGWTGNKITGYCITVEIESREDTGRVLSSGTTCSTDVARLLGIALIEAAVAVDRKNAALTHLPPPSGESVARKIEREQDG